MSCSCHCSSKLLNYEFWIFTNVLPNNNLGKQTCVQCCKHGSFSNHFMSCSWHCSSKFRNYEFWIFTNFLPNNNLSKQTCVQCCKHGPFSNRFRHGHDIGVLNWQTRPLGHLGVEGVENYFRGRLHLRFSKRRICEFDGGTELLCSIKKNRNY